jgi:hypothetical protein
MAEARRRVAEEGASGGILSEGLGAPLADLVDWSAVLHDLGKLQTQWQQWAEAAQRARDPLYRHTELLAHTDFDSSDAGDRALARAIRPLRPHHSSASAYYGFQVLELAGPSMPLTVRVACISAVLGHHGGWVERTVLPLHPRWESDLREVWPGSPQAAVPTPSLAAVDRLWAGISSMKLQFATWWPLTAYLTRTLRLSDQLATEEGSQDG